jgi:excinuclease UvrABC ATPase subunit
MTVNSEVKQTNELKKELQSYQAKRIANTYNDFKNNPQYAKLYHFFLEHIYGPRDFGFRNQSIKSLYKKLTKFLHGEIIDAIGKVIELNDLSDSLDNQMAALLEEQGFAHNISDQRYKELYKSCNNYEQRKHQIELLVDSVKGVHHVSQMRFIGISLKAVQKAAHLAGIGKIMDFLVEGYEAFRSADDINFFTDMITERETALNDELFEVAS